MPEKTNDIQIEDQSKLETSSYRGIFKATSLFGGVQIYQIFVSIIKSKFVALLLGPLGIGIQGLYSSALLFVQSLTEMGLKSSAVKDVSEANGSCDMVKIAVVVKTLRRLVWCTGLLGMLVVIAFSPVLSKTSFGDNEHIIAFMCLSVTLLLDQLCGSQKVVLQGMRRLKYLAMASAIGTTASLFFSVPLYYLYGVKGIVPALILNSITQLILSWHYEKKVKLPQIGLTIKDTLKHGTGMLKMGLAMSWSGILVLGCAYVLRWFIREETGTEAVGLYSAGFTIINTYVGMIFTAIGTDYYPRLASVNNDNYKMRIIVNQQGEVAALIMAPLLIVCIVFMPLVLTILYSDQFLGANDYVILAAIGIMFKLGSWLIAYLFIAKGESKLFIVNEIITNVYFLLFNILGYRYWGITGLGAAFILSYFIYFVQVFIIARKRYEYKMSNDFKKIMLLQLLLLGLGYIVVQFENRVIVYTIGVLLIILSSIYSFIQLNKRMEVSAFFKKWIRKEE